MILFHENFRSFSSSPFLAAMFKRCCSRHPFQVYYPDSSLCLSCPGFLLTAVLSQVSFPSGPVSNSLVPSPFLPTFLTLLSCSDRPVQSFLPRMPCPTVAVLFRLFCNGCPVCCLILAVQGCPYMVDKISQNWNSFSGDLKVMDSQYSVKWKTNGFLHFRKNMA
jgi:hypothetical protein